MGRIPSKKYKTPGSSPYKRSKAIVFEDEDDTLVISRDKRGNQIKHYVTESKRTAASKKSCLLPALVTTALAKDTVNNSTVCLPYVYRHNTN